MSVATGIRDQLLGLGSATVAESGGRALHPRIKPAWPGARLAAPVYTVTCPPGDNLAIHLAVAEAPAGSALLVDAHERPERGCGVRDVAAVATHGFPMFSALVALPGATKLGGGAVGGLARVAGADVSPGDWVVGDADGVTVVTGRDVEAVLVAAWSRANKETAMFDRLRQGSTTLELLGLDARSVERSEPPSDR
ncbi:MAG: dimethylmenaquinone methyltransferase [Actinobacteria bacterium]|nr:MAG: dimethylmenaquinone methyltransferase [Actinomycetota bacterium]